MASLAPQLISVTGVKRSSTPVLVVSHFKRRKNVGIRKLTKLLNKR